LGEKLEVDPKLVIPNHNLSIAEGAIFPWARASHKVGRQSFFWWQLSQLSEEYSFSLNEPIRNLPKKILNIILYGNGRFEGVIPNLERRHHQTDSDYTRDEIEKYMVGKQCEKCQGKRLKPEVLAVTITGKSIDDIVSMSIDKAKDFFEKLSRIKSESRANKSKYSYKFASNSFKLASSESKIAHPVVKEILNRLQFLIDVGLDYLALKRKAETLAGGEEQRIKLATQIGSKLTGVLYILDEPSVGLHFRDQKRLIETLKKLRDLGNTLVVVEHDPQTIKAADWVIDIGPGAGKHGGRVIFEGTPKELLKAKTLTGEYLSGKKRVEITRQISKSPGLSEARNSPEGCFLISKQIPWTRSELPEGLHSKSQIQNYLIIKGAKEHNLKNIDVKIPLGLFVCITGVSGSGKSSLMQDILCRALMRKFYNSKEEPGAHETILGWERLDKVVLVDQSPIGRTPRSNPATYTGAFSYIRTLFARTREARIRGYQSGRFSFNVKGGRCEACQGQGQNKIEMYFLPDVYVECQECDGKRYNKEALEIEVKGKNIAQVLEMTTEEALDFFKNIPGLFQKLKTLNEVGLGYIQLGQPAPSLSGGEAQRVKLSAELSKKGTGRTLYILDEPTTGLHFDDIKKLLRVLGALVDRGNTVVVIEHQIDLVKNADWIIDLGPEGGEKGGYIVAEGTPLEISKNKKSYTGRYLKLYLAPH